MALARRAFVYMRSRWMLWARASPVEYGKLSKNVHTELGSCCYSVASMIVIIVFSRIINSHLISTQTAQASLVLYVLITTWHNAPVTESVQVESTFSQPIDEIKPQSRGEPHRRCERALGLCWKLDAERAGMTRARTR